MSGEIGTVYLLHFVDPTGAHSRFHHAGHYLGWAANLEARLEHHRRGSGANLLRHVMLAGLDFVVARTWEGVDRHFERRLHNRKCNPRLCPICGEDK